MSVKHALVVDDSKSARVAMKRMLKKYALKVDFAESGEEALLFLEHSSADVIFMDHNMPGMDGLETVSAIKSNPRTATIPVMMYTTNNDDVYVSQARALGALAVLPKEVQPGVLFDTLLKLGLVENRREEPEKVPFAQLVQDVNEPNLPSEADEAFDKQALSVSIQTQITRILEEQHLQLRSDILNVKRDFAKRVSREITDQQRTDQRLVDTVAQTEAENNEFTFAPLARWAIPIILLLAVLSGITFSSLNKQNQVSNALNVLTSSVEAISNKITELPQLTLPKTQTSNAAESPLVQVQNEQFIQTLEWILNEYSHHDYVEMAFNQQTVLTLEKLLAQLDALDFSGHVQMESHLGEFCLVNDGNAGVELAPGNLPLSQCDLIGHPKDDSVFINDQQTVEFINFIDSSPVLSNGDIRITTIANNGQSSTRKYILPSEASNADDWNRIARMNNRIVYSLIPD